ncbi:MAG: hypothetical protein ACXVQJ_02995 [Actinomycetota bacterium]
MRRRKEIYGLRRASRTVAVTTARRAGRAGALWGLVFGATIAATETSFSSAFPTAASRAQLALSVGGNVGFEAVFGQIRQIGTVPGYTAYKTMFTLILLGAIWGLFVATRSLRGEEDAGRWELFLSGQTTRRGAAVQAALGLGAAIVALWVPTAAVALAAGASAKVGIGAGTSLYFATAVVSAAAMFMAVGMLTAQLAASRHDANLFGAGVLAASYLIRMMADSDPGLSWLRWASPLGWVEELHALTGSDPLGFVPIVMLTVVLVTVAIQIAGRRDLGGSAFASRDTPRPRTLLLGGQAGLTIRLTRPAVVAWVAVMGACGLVFGLVTQAAGSAMQGSPGLERVIGRLGGRTAGAALYLGFVFLIAAGLVAIAVAGQISAIRNEEAAGHLDNLLARSVERRRWLGVRLGVGLALVLVASVFAGVAAWVGAATQHTGLALGELVKAGLNVAPPAVFVLGVGALVFGLWPRAAIGVVYGLVVWSFLVEALAAVFDANHWLRDTSPLLHITPAPAAAPDWTAAAWLVGLGLVAAAIGIEAFRRRDLVGA